MKDTNKDSFNILTFIKRNKFYLLAVLSLPLITYLNNINGALISDDIGLAKGVKTFVFHFNFEFVESFLRYLWLAPTFFIFGDNPIPYHFANIAFHLANVFLVYLITTRLKGRNFGLLVALLFGIHPLLAEGVDWISSGGYLQANFFFLLAFYFYVFKSSDKKYYYLFLISYFLMLLSFNRSSLLFILFYLYELSLGNLKSNWKKLVPITLLSIFWLMIFIPLIPGRIKEINGINNQTIDLTTYPLVLLYSLSSYIKLFLWPIPLSFYHNQFILSTLEVTFRIVILVTYFSFVVVSYFKNRFLFFWLAFFPVSLIMFLNPLGINWIVAERYIYLGSIGLIVPVAYLFSSLIKKDKFKLIAYSVFFILIALLAIRTFIRNLDWKNQNTLYAAIQRVYPNSPGAQSFTSKDSSQDQEKSDLDSLEANLKSYPDQPQSYYNLGRYYQDKKDYQTAISYYQQAIEKDSNFYLAYQNLANTYYFSGDVDKAIETDTKAVSLKEDPSIYVNLGVFYQKKQDWQKASDAFRNALKLDPNTPHAKDGLDQSESLLQGKVPSISK